MIVLIIVIWYYNFALCYMPKICSHKCIQSFRSSIQITKFKTKIRKLKSKKFPLLSDLLVEKHLGVLLHPVVDGVGVGLHVAHGLDVDPVGMAEQLVGDNDLGGDCKSCDVPFFGSPSERIFWASLYMCPSYA